MERHIMYEREKRTPLELASDPKAFANTYAELCGVIPIDDLVDLYRKAFPELPMDYETMCKAAAGRAASWNGVCETWTHEDVEALLDVRVSRPVRGTTTPSATSPTPTSCSPWRRSTESCRSGASTVGIRRRYERRC